MKCARNPVGLLMALLVAVLLVGAGFLVCVLPVTTKMLAAAFSDDVTSPFERGQLVSVADVSRDYAFGAHDRGRLYEAIYRANVELQAKLEDAGQPIPAGFPRLEEVSSTEDVNQIEKVLLDASEVFSYSEGTIQHLDDCNAIARVAYSVLAAVALATIVCFVLCVTKVRKQIAGTALRLGGAVVLVALVVLGVFAAVDFERFFTLFHGVLFSQGNWQFPYDSLLICSLPEAFWAGMGVVWLVASIVASMVCVAFGTKLSRAGGTQ